MTNNGQASSVDFSIRVRLLNLTERALAVEAFGVAWQGVRSPHIPQLKTLSDPDPSIKELDDPYGEKIHEDTLLPLLLPPNGGVLFIQLNAKLGFFRRTAGGRLIRFYPTINVDEPETYEVINEIDRGYGIVTIRVGGKVRSVPVTFWRH